MKKSILILGVFLFCLLLPVSGCRYPIKGADFVADSAEEVAYLGEGQELAPIAETEAERRARWERIERISFQQLMEDYDSFWFLDTPSKLNDKYIR